MPELGAMRRRVKERSKDLLAQLGLEVRRRTPTNSLDRLRESVIADQSIDLVIDGGANVGDWAACVRKSGFRGTIVSFEPMAAPFQALSLRTAGDPTWQAERVGLGAARRRQKIHVASNSVSSSLLPMRTRHMRAAPGSGQIGSEDIQVERLDDVILCDGASRVYLKLDLQGSEMSALDGATDLLTHTRAVEVELSLVSLYEGDVRLPEAFGRLADLGFECVGIYPDFVDEARGRVLQQNGIFEVQDRRGDAP